MKCSTVSVSATILTSVPSITLTSVPSGTSRSCSASTVRGSDRRRLMKTSSHQALATIWLHNRSSEIRLIIHLLLQNERHEKTPDSAFGLDQSFLAESPLKPRL